MRNSWAIKNHIKASWEQYKLSGDTWRVVLVTAVFGKSSHTQGKSNRNNTKARVSLCSRKPWTLKEHLLLYEINCIFYGTMNTGNNERTDIIHLYSQEVWIPVSKIMCGALMWLEDQLKNFYPSAAQQRGSLSLWLTQSLIFSAAPTEHHYPPPPWLIWHLSPPAPQCSWPALSDSSSWPISEI